MRGNNIAAERGIVRGALLLGILLLAACGGPPAEDRQLLAGIARVPITPTTFETFQDLDGDHLKGDNEPFNDTGVDRLFDPQEPGAFGADGKPGVAGVDDNTDTVVDDPGEYLAPSSDDRPDPAGDNYDQAGNPGGTEGDGVFQAVVLAGYAGFVTGEDIRPALEIHDDLYATTLAVTRGETTVLLVSLDLVGFWHHYMNPVKRRLEQEAGVPADNIIIAATHTHAGPDSIGLWAFEHGFDTSYARLVMEKIFESAIAALERREPARMKSSTTYPAACYDRDTLIMKTDPECRLGAQESENMDQRSQYDQHILQNDLRDPWVRNTKVAAMRFDRQDGSAIATLVNFHDHPEIFGDEANVISSDFPYYTRQALEDRFGGTAIYFSGTLGSQIGAWDPTPVPLYDAAGNPVYRDGEFDTMGSPFPEFVVDMGEAKVRSVGIIVANEAIRGLEAASYTEDPAVEIRTEMLDIVPEHYMAKALSLLILSLDEDYPQEADLPMKGGECGLVGCARIPVSVVRLGDASMVTSPGETAPEYMVGRAASTADYRLPWPDFHFPAMPAIEDAMPGRDKFMIGLANSYFGYTVPAGDYLSVPLLSSHPNYYEDELSPGPHFGDSVGDKILEMLGSNARFSDLQNSP